MPDAPQPYSLTTVREDDRTVIAVFGEIDIATAENFGAAVREALAAGPVLLDLSDLSFMDSSGLRILIGLLREAEHEGWSLLIGNDLHHNVRRLLTMTGMLDMLPLEDTKPASESR